jgi:hypothetical protein
MGRKVNAMKVHRVGFNTFSGAKPFFLEIAELDYTVWHERRSIIVGSL